MIAASLMSTAGLLALAAPQGDPPPAQRPQVLRIVPLDDLVGHSPAPRVPMPPFARDKNVFQWPSGLLVDDDGERIDADSIGELVAQWADRLGGEAELSLTPHSQSLWLRGDERIVERSAEFVRGLVPALAAPLLVEAWLVEGDANDGEMLGTTFASGQHPLRERATWHATTRTRSGRTATLARWTTSGYVARVDMSVASESVNIVPEIMDLGSGVHLAVEPHALSSSRDLVVFGHLAVAARRPNAVERPVAPEGQPWIELPVLDDLVMTFSARIPDGGGCAVGLLGAADTGSSKILVLRVGREAPAAADSAQGVAVLPIGALTRPPLGGRIVLPGRGEEAYPVIPPAFAEDRGEPPIAGEDLVDLILNAALAEVGDGGDPSAHRFGDAIVLLGPAAALDRARATVAGLEELLLKHTTVVLRTSRGDDTLHELVFPAMLGRQHFALRGIETRVVREFFGNVAQKISAIIPGVRPSFAGVQAAVKPSPALAGGVFVEACIEWFETQQQRPHRIGGDQPAEWSDVAERRTRFHHAGPVEQGQAIHFGDGPSATSGYARQVLELR